MIDYSRAVVGLCGRHKETRRRIEKKTVRGLQRLTRRCQGELMMVVSNSGNKKEGESDRAYICIRMTINDGKIEGEGGR